MKSKSMFLVVFLFLILTAAGNAQIAQNWASRYSGTQNSDEARAIVLDASNNVYVTGRSMSASNGYDIVTVKYNTSGVVQWTAVYNGTGNSSDEGNDIAFDGTYIYVTGVTTRSPSTGLDYVTIKYNASTGAPVWTSVFNGLGNLDDVATRVVARNNRVYVTGKGFYTGTVADYVTIKYNAATGDSIWIKNYNGTGNGNDSATFLKVSSSDSAVYITGKSYGGASNYDIATVKYNNAGTQNWAKRYNGSANGDDIGISIAFNDGNNGPEVFVAGQIVSTGTGNDIIAIKYTSAGVESWTRIINGTSNAEDIPAALIYRSDSEIYLAGKQTNTGTGADFILIKYDNAGTAAYTKNYNGSANGNDEATSVIYDGSGYVYVAGKSNETSTGDDYTVIKYTSAGAVEWIHSYNYSGSGTDRPARVIVDATSDRNVYVTGSSFSGSTGTNYATLKLKQDKVLDLNVFIQGFYNPATNTTVRDTVRVLLYNSAATTIIDSAKIYLDTLGKGRLYFRVASNSTSYRIVIHHRNLIETWGNSTNSFSNLYLTYDFTTAATKAYGSNQIQVDASPVEYANYNGDVNKDGAVDVSDLIQIYNDANVFATGYIVSDLNGDNYADVSDLIIAFNNSANFVSVIRP